MLPSLLLRLRRFSRSTYFSETGHIFVWEDLIYFTTAAYQSDRGCWEASVPSFHIWPLSAACAPYSASLWMAAFPSVAICVQLPEECEESGSSEISLLRSARDTPAHRREFWGGGLKCPRQVPPALLLASSIRRAMRAARSRISVCGPAQA